MCFVGLCLESTLNVSQLSGQAPITLMMAPFRRMIGDTNISNHSPTLGRRGTHKQHRRSQSHKTQGRESDRVPISIGYRLSINPNHPAKPPLAVQMSLAVLHCTLACDCDSLDLPRTQYFAVNLCRL